MKNYLSIKILIACVAVFILQITFGITDLIVLVRGDAFVRPWMFLTSMFAHGSFLHLFYNMLALFMFGTILESMIGTKRFAALYFTSGLLASVVSYFAYPASLGASGAIYGVLGTLAVLRPKMIVYVGYIPMPMVVAAFIWACGDILGLFVPSGIANAAHLTGLAVGVVYGFLLHKELESSIRQSQISFA